MESDRGRDAGRTGRRAVARVPSRLLPMYNMCTNVKEADWNYDSLVTPMVAGDRDA